MQKATDEQIKFLNNALADGINKFIKEPANIETYFYLRSMPEQVYDIRNTFILLSQLSGNGSRPYKINNRGLQILKAEDWMANFGAVIPEEIDPMYISVQGSTGLTGVEEVYSERDIVIPPGVVYLPNTLETTQIRYEMLFSAILYAMRYGNREWTDKTGKKHAELPRFFSNVVIERSTFGNTEVSVDDNKNTIRIAVSQQNADDEARKKDASRLLFQLFQAYLRRLLPKEQFERSGQLDLFEEIIELAAFYSIISRGCPFPGYIEGEDTFVNKPDKLLARIKTVENLKETIDGIFMYYTLTVSGEMPEPAPEKEGFYGEV